ncbi:MAG: ATP-binding protein [Prolixibacteraceae bacterium]
MNRIIVITGPESTAKSTLTRELSAYFGGNFFPEYAREYLTGKEAGYTYADVEQIARKQIKQYQAARQFEGLVFLDTWLIITRTWFDWVFNKVPSWLEEAIANHPVDLFLLCRPDIPWQPDPLRENGGEQREKLFMNYRQELQSRGFFFMEVGGEGDLRVRNAIEAVKAHIYLPEISSL